MKQSTETLLIIELELVELEIDFLKEKLRTLESKKQVIKNTLSTAE